MSVRRLPGVFQPRRAPAVPPARHVPRLQARAQWLFWAWAAAMGALLFVAWWLQRRGAWRALVEGDPSGISVGIVVLTVLVSGWCGLRARVLAAATAPGSAWRRAHAEAARRAPAHAADLLAERTHGAHETAWWFASTAIKLGLLGTVVGFIVMAAQIGRMPSFDLEQVQRLLKQMTGGMAIALYTTLVGLIANLLLGLQLLLLDRLADQLAADMLMAGDAEAEAGA